MREIKPDAIIVVGYGRIIPQWMIDLPPLGNLNLHASLLPKYRGAAPIQWAIARGESVTGVTTMRIDAGLDTGDILLQKEIPIAPQDTAVTLAPRMAAIGADLMVETLRGLQAGTIHPRPQDHAKATLAPILKKEDGRIDFQLYRPGNPESPARLPALAGRVHQLSREESAHLGGAASRARRWQTAEILVESGHLIVGCGAGSALQLLEVQMEGKKRMPAADFVHGYQPRTGEKLGPTEQPGTNQLTTEFSRNPCPFLPLAPQRSTSCFASSSRMPMHPSYCTRANMRSSRPRTMAWPPNW